MAQLDERGREILCQTPLAYPVAFQRPEPLHLRIRRMVMQSLMEQAQSDEVETFEEADDFDVDDEPVGFDGPTPYEEHFDHLQPEPAPAPVVEPEPVPAPAPAAEPATSE